MKRGKKYLAAQAKLTKEVYLLDEAIELLAETSITKFDSSCEIHFNLGIDPRHAEQQLRSTVSLPHGTGKEVKVIAFCAEEDVAEAKKAGAIKAGEDDLIEEISKGFLGFDVAVATPPMMKKIGKIAKTLGQKGLMPNPKAGTVTTDLTATIADIKKGKVEYRNDKQGNIHNMVGKLSFGKDKLKENLVVFIKAIVDAKPAAMKGNYVNTITLTTAMGPGIKLDVSETIASVR